MKEFGRAEKQIDARDGPHFQARLGLLDRVLLSPKEHRESSRSDNESQARKLLKRRLGEVGSGRLIGPSEERLTFDDLSKMLLTDYEINGKRSVESVRLSLRHLRNFFGPERSPR